MEQTQILKLNLKEFNEMDAYLRHHRSSILVFITRSIFCRLFVETQATNPKWQNQTNVTSSPVKKSQTLHQTVGMHYVTPICRCTKTQIIKVRKYLKCCNLYFLSSLKHVVNTKSEYINSWNINFNIAFVLNLKLLNIDGFSDPH